MSLETVDHLLNRNNIEPSSYMNRNNLKDKLYTNTNYFNENCGEKGRRQD